MKEPIRKPWIWVVVLALFVFNAPWYLPSGMIEPFVFGLPLWVVIVVVMSILLSAFLHWACTTQWNIVEDDELAATPTDTDRGESA